MEVKNNIILAMDLMDLNAAEEVCNSVSDYINTIKIGYPLTLAEGLEVVTYFKEDLGYKVVQRSKEVGTNDNEFLEGSIKE